MKTWFQNRRAKWRRCNNSATADEPTLENQNESDSDSEICDTSETLCENKASSN